MTTVPSSIPHTSMACAIEVVEAYVANNRVPARDGPDPLKLAHAALMGLGDRTSPPAPFERVACPDAAAIRASVRPDGIVSFIDCGTYKTLKGHLTAHRFDPRSYRERYGLPADHSMITHAYRRIRSESTKGIGLGVERDDTGRPVSARARSDRRSSAPAATA